MSRPWHGCISSSVETCFFCRHLFLNVTSKKRLDELEEKSAAQNKNINRNMNQKEWSLSADCPQKMKIMILNGDFMRAAEAAF